MRRRKAAIKGLEWRITPTGNEKTDEILTALFDRLPVSQIINQILDATLFGYQALEVMWENQNGLLLPVAVVGKPQEWFVFDEENRLMLRTKDKPQRRPCSGKEIPACDATSGLYEPLWSSRPCYVLLGGDLQERWL